MINSPSQWQIDNISDGDKIVVSKKSFIMKLIDLISMNKPNFVKVKQELNNKLVETKVDSRQVTIFSKEEMNSKISEPINYMIVNNDGTNKTRTGLITAISSYNQLYIQLDDKMIALPISNIINCNERSKRRQNLLSENSSSLDYNLVYEKDIFEFEYKGSKYEFKNGMSLKLLVYKLNKTDSKKDKYVLVENLFKLTSSDNDLHNAESKLLDTLTDRIKLSLIKSSDKNYNPMVLEQSPEEIINKYIDITEIKEESNQGTSD